MSRAPIDAMLDADVEWLPAERGQDACVPGHEGLPHATHSGVWHFMGESLRCHRLCNGRAVFEAEDFERVFGPMVAALSEVRR